MRFSDTVFLLGRRYGTAGMRPERRSKAPEAGANLVAIDIAKAWNVVLVQEASGRKRNFKVANNAADHDQLLLYLSSLTGRTRIAFEPTGTFIAHLPSGS